MNASVVHLHSVANQCAASCPLKEASFLATTGNADKATCHSCIKDVDIATGSSLYSSGAPPSFAYFIRTGAVKLVRDTSGGNKRIVRIIGADRLVGEEALFSSMYGHHAIAMEDVTACKIPLSYFKRAVHAMPGVQRELLASVHMALMDTETVLCEFAGCKSRVRERMARLLLHLRDGESNRIRHLSLGEFGSLLGVAAETVCRNLSALTRAGVLNKRGGDAHCEADIERLMEIACGKKQAGCEPAARPVGAEMPAEIAA